MNASHWLLTAEQADKTPGCACRKNLEQRSMAFRPFFTTRRGGLVQVKRMVEQCGGVFSRESREGDGTVCPPAVQANSLNMGMKFTQ